MERLSITFNVLWPKDSKCELRKEVRTMACKGGKKKGGCKKGGKKKGGGCR